MATETKNRPPLLPLPDGVTETVGIPADGGIVRRKDGTSMLLQGGGVHDTGIKQGSVIRTSKDGGKTWSDPQPFACPIGIGGVVRLSSGALAIFGKKTEADADPFAYYSSTSSDDGASWSDPVLISRYPNYRPMHHSLVQLSSGRLLLTGYWEGLNGHHPDLERYTRTGWGLWRGKVIFMEGHRGVEMGICVTFYSDDEGKSWTQSPGGVFGWFDRWGEPNGQDGIVDLYEPNSAETADGRVLMFSRSKTGRLVQSFSHDMGTTWNSAQPTELASSQSPALLIRIPTSGDLLCVWNHVSAEEVRRGMLRNRLSAAVSPDNATSWVNFRTIERSGGVAAVDYVAPESPIARRIVARPSIGVLPDGFAMFTYPNVDIIDETVFIRYARMWPRFKQDATVTARDPNLPLMWPRYEEREAEMTGEGVLRAYPLSWFYEGSA